MIQHQKILLVYDYECPACNAYCRLIRIKNTVGDLQLINARENRKIVHQITDRGLDIDQGMVLVVDGNYYYGADAIHALSLLSTRSGVFNKLNYWLFKSPVRSRLLYPILRFFRNLLLKALRKRKINNLGLGGNDRF